MWKVAYLIQPSSTKRHFHVSLQPIISVCPISPLILQPDGTGSDVETRAYLLPLPSLHFGPLTGSRINLRSALLPNSRQPHEQHKAP